MPPLIQAVQIQLRYGKCWHASGIIAINTSEHLLFRVQEGHTGASMFDQNICTFCSILGQYIFVDHNNF